jgi:hypothetical protein
MDEENFDKVRKARSIASDEGTRNVVRFIKAPETNG